MYQFKFLFLKAVKSISGELLLPLSNPKFFNVLMLLDPEKRRSLDHIPKLCSFDPDSGNYNILFGKKIPENIIFVGPGSGKKSSRRGGLFFLIRGIFFRVRGFFSGGFRIFSGGFGIFIPGLS